MQPPPGPPPYGYPPPPGYPPPYQQPFAPQRPPQDPMLQSARMALGISIASVVLCCVPIGGLAAYFALRARSLAKQRGVPVPGPAMAALALSAVSLFLSLGAVALYVMDVHRRDAREAELEAETKDKRGAKTLSSQTACELFEAQLLKGLYEDETFVTDVKCTGDYVSSADAASLPHVSFKHAGTTTVVRGCLARTKRWFVAGYVPPGLQCPKVSLESKLGKKPSDKELDAEEDALRKTWKEKSDGVMVDDFARAVKAANDDASDDDAKKSCGALDLSDVSADDSTKLHTVDAWLLDDPKSAQGWQFLTSDEMQTALDEARPASARADAIRKIAGESGPFVAIYTSTVRALPKLGKKDAIGGGSFVGGGFVGVLHVVDLRKSTTVCGVKVKFESSKSLKTDTFVDDDEVNKQLNDDLVSNYKKAIADAMKQATSGRLAVVGAE